MRDADTNQTRIVKKVVPTDSFFSFFSPPLPPTGDEDEDDEDLDDDLDEKLELDYQIGEDLKERVVPRAVDFFTGKALRMEQGPGGFGDEDSEFDDEFDEEDDESCVSFLPFCRTADSKRTPFSRWASFFFFFKGTAVPYKSLQGSRYGGRQGNKTVVLPIKGSNELTMAEPDLSG